MSQPLRAIDVTMEATSDELLFYRHFIGWLRSLHPREPFTAGELLKKLERAPGFQHDDRAASVPDKSAAPQPADALRVGLPHTLPAVGTRRGPCLPPGESMRRVIEYFSEHSEPAAAKVIADAVGLPPSNIYNLVNAGRLERFGEDPNGRAQFRLTVAQPWQASA